MSVDSLLTALLSGDLPRALQIFTPELILCSAIILLLLLRMTGFDRRLPACWVALLGVMLAFAGVFSQFMYLKWSGEPLGAAGPASRVLGGLFNLFRLSPEGVGTIGGYFSDLQYHDEFTLFMRLGLLLFTVLVVALTVLSGIPDNEDGPDFYTLLLGATLGMLVATSANHLLMMFLGVEMISVPSYVMVGFLKGRRQSSEAALKYVVYGAGAAGVMLYGISLLTGLLGTAEFSEMSSRAAVILQGDAFALSSPTAVTLVLAILLVLVGLAFKLSLVPFHFWCPDAFEGASAEVGGYLSVASKAAAFALLVRFLLAFDGPAEVLADMRTFLGLVLALIAGVSITFGNLAAYSQRNIKRLLAYSTIAHAGYMVMAVAAMLVLTGKASAAELSQAGAAFETARCMEGLMYYLGVYLFMNLVAFAVAAMLRNEIYSEDIDSYRGLIYQKPATKTLCICMAIALFSLVGLPPFGGFFAKLLIFLAVFKAGYLHWGMWLLLVVAAANTVFSLFYYLRVVQPMFFSQEAEPRRNLRTPGIVGLYVALITIPIVLLGASPLQHGVTRTAREVAQALFR